ncbi:MAG: mycofactocin precursor MftA [Acidimicrobiales bacterium]
MPELAREPTAVAAGAAGDASLGGRAHVPAAANAAPGLAPLVEDEMLVEEISIDGMCGVY